ncbi:uncharacterized protein LOC117102408 [Anneissia japonica]|uniref:uncharacterized protein LOC117102408 n=1 Tax=Anneissia japonica TaxID=1529436 RepID=UPI0014256CB8|nr:uncharacterized protein LOC117102408 [Anneissia japonica]
MNNIVSKPHPFLESPGTPTVPWKTWKIIFENYLLAADLQAGSAERGKAILIASFCTEAQRIYYTLLNSKATSVAGAQQAEADGDKDEYKETMQLLADYFEPKLNVVAERYKFRCRSHEPGETVKAFVLALKHLASTCQFANLHDDMIRDQIVEKTNSTRVRERLLMEKELTLTKAIQIEPGVPSVFQGGPLSAYVP